MGATLRHLLNPARAARVARRRIEAHIDLSRFVSRAEIHFRGDARYDLQNVRDGFRSRIDDSTDDPELLARICAAYAKAVADQPRARPVYEPTDWWKQLRRDCLGPVIEALSRRDIARLRLIYRNFFRDPCSTGLISVPYGMVKTYPSRLLKDLDLHAYMGDALYRIDRWLSETGGSFPLSCLAGPQIGNPFGVRIDGVLVSIGSEYHHYCAQKIRNQLRSDSASGRGVVAEIGGGYGGMAYYLLRDEGDLTYIDFDVPESIALTSYYLLKAFPSSKFVLYGEKPLTAETIADSDGLLMPLFAMPGMPVEVVNLTFSSHAIADLSHDAMAEYVGVITRMTKNYLAYCGNAGSAGLLSKLLSEGGGCGPVELRPSGWNRHRSAKAKEVECLYQL
jgi:hypothetical protein